MGNFTKIKNIKNTKLLKRKRKLKKGTRDLFLKGYSNYN